MKYDDLKPRQQEFIQKLYEGLLNESVELEEDFQIQDEYTRVYLRYMSSKYADMEWAPAWIVKDNRRQGSRWGRKVGLYKIPELKEYSKLAFSKACAVHGTEVELST